MRFPLVVITQPNRTALYVSIREPLELGRDCDGILLADPQVSRRHLRLWLADGVLHLADLGSRNGTSIDGARLDGEGVLQPGSVVLLGDTAIELIEAPSPQPDVHTTLGPGDPRQTELAALTTQTARVRPRGSQSSQARQTSIERVAVSAQEARVDLGSLPTDQGTITIAFSDIESSTERNVELGDQVWFEILGVHNEVVRRNVAAMRGTVIKNQGDGFMLSFPGARLAIQSMAGVQRDLEQLAIDRPDRAVRVRIGMHTGEVVVDDEGDLFGKHVVIAARVANLALGGEILVSSLTKEIVASRGDMFFGKPREVELKGIGTEMVYPQLWNAPSDKPEG